MDKKNILILDDDHNVTNVYRHILESDYNVIIFNSPLNAIDYLKTSMAHTVISACIVDMMMPEMDGVQFVAKLREFDKDIKIICMTGYSGTYPEKNLTQYGISAYLIKPFHKQELMDHIAKALQSKDETTVDKYDVVEDTERINNLFSDLEKHNMVARINWLNDNIINNF